MISTVYPSLREAIHGTATSSPRGCKAIAADLDWSPTELSMRTTLGGDSARPFPADDDHLIRLQRVTGDYSILATMADLLGFEIVPKRERTAELLVEVQQAIRTLAPKIQLVLDLGAEPEPTNGTSSKRKR